MSFRRLYKLGPFTIALITSTVLGLAPATWFLKGPKWALYVALLSLFASISVAVSQRRPARPLSVLESIALGLAGLGFTGIYGLMLLVFYWAVFWVLTLVRAVPMLARHLPSNPGNIAQGFASFVCIIFAVASALGTGAQLSGSFFPPTGIGHEPLFPKVTWRGFLPVATLGLLASAGLVVLFLHGWRWAFVVLQLFLFISSVPFLDTLPSRKPPVQQRKSFFPTEPSVWRNDVTTALTKLLEATHFELINRLESRREDIDRLIANLDVVAVKESYALAFQIYAGDSSDPPVTRAQAESVRTAALVLYHARESSLPAVRTIQPVLLLAGCPAEPGLKEFCEQQSIRLVEFSDRDLTMRIVFNDFSWDELRQIAETHLGIYAHREKPNNASRISERN